MLKAGEITWVCCLVKKKKECVGPLPKGGG